MKRYVTVESTKLKGNPKRTNDPEVQIATEGEQLLSALHGRDFVVALDERGQQYTSHDFAHLIAKAGTTLDGHALPAGHCYRGRALRTRCRWPRKWRPVQLLHLNHMSCTLQHCSAQQPRLDRCRACLLHTWPFRSYLRHTWPCRVPACVPCAYLLDTWPHRDTCVPTVPASYNSHGAHQAGVYTMQTGILW